MNRETAILNAKGVKETPNRILVLRALMCSESPLSFTEIEDELPTVDKSSIFRVLQCFVEHGIVHLLEGGDGTQRYEVCHAEGECSLADMHIHFFCIRCHRTFCFENMPVPRPDFPAGFEVRAANYMVKGLCPKCSKTTSCDV